MIQRPTINPIPSVKRPRSTRMKPQCSMLPSSLDKRFVSREDVSCHPSLPSWFTRSCNTGRIIDQASSLALSICLKLFFPYQNLIDDKVPLPEIPTVLNCIRSSLYSHCIGLAEATPRLVGRPQPGHAGAR